MTGKQKLVVIGNGMAGCRAVEAVPYTHLTLPTISSV